MFIPAGYESEFDSENEMYDFDFNDENKPKFNGINEAVKENDEKTKPSIFVPKFSTNETEDNQKDGKPSYFTNSDVLNQKLYGKGPVLDENVKRMVLKEDIEMMKKLIDNNELDINYQFSSGWSLSSYSLFTKRYLVVEFLLDLKADFNCGSMSGLSAIAYAYYKTLEELDGSLTILEKVLPLSNLNTVDNYGKTAMVIALENNNFHIVEVFLKNHADIFIDDINGKNLFDYALAKKSNKIIQLLLSYFESYAGEINSNGSAGEKYTNLLNTLLEKLGPNSINVAHEYMMRNLLESKTMPPYPFKNIVDFCVSYKKTCNVIEDKDGDILNDFLCGIQMEKWFNNFQSKGINFKQFLQLSSDNLVKSININTNDANYIIKSKNELILNGLDSGVFTKSSDDLNVFDLAISNANTYQHLQFIQDCCDSYITTLMDAQNKNSNYSEYFIQLATKHTNKNIDSCRQLMEKLNQLKNILENKRSSSTWFSKNLVCVTGTMIVCTAMAYKMLMR